MKLDVNIAEQASTYVKFRCLRQGLVGPDAAFFAPEPHRYVHLPCLCFYNGCKCWEILFKVVALEVFLDVAKELS